MKILACPRCGSQRVRISRKRGHWRWLRRLACIHTLRCDSCKLRFRSRTLRWRYMFYAKCPQCAGLELTDWQEKYYYPKAHLRALVYFGWRQQRCDSCRYNFVSFRPRWRPKKENGSK